MLQALRRRAALQDGYTLVELAVVVLVVGILATLALPMFLGQRGNAHDSAAKADVANMVRHMQACFVENGTFAGCETTLTSARTGLSIGSGPGQVEIVGQPTDTTYVLRATSRASGPRRFTLTHTASGDVRACAPSGGGCRGTGW
jgi:type IV pilus assembly protein PilA